MSDLGRFPTGHATHEQNPQAVSAVPVGIVSADRLNYSIVQFNRMVRVGTKELLLAVARHHYKAKRGTPEGRHWRAIIQLNSGKVATRPEPKPIVEFVAPAVKLPLSPREANLADIDTIAERHKLTREDILGTRKMRPIIDARHECIALFRSRGFSTLAIGRIMQRDHSTIVHALQKMNFQEAA